MLINTRNNTGKNGEKMPIQSLLVKQENYLESGIHIGTKLRTDDMRSFIFKRRDDGLYILDLRKTDERLLRAAKLISRFRPEDVLVVASRAYSGNPASRFSALTGIPGLYGRFVPGTMTNLAYAGFQEPKLIVVCDPKGERDAIIEGSKNSVPVIALCDSDNETKFIDLVVPVNNKGKRALALIFYILAREVMLAQGKIKSYDEFAYPVSYFEQSLDAPPAKPVAAPVAAAPRKETAAPAETAVQAEPAAPAETPAPAAAEGTEQEEAAEEKQEKNGEGKPDAPATAEG